MADYHDAREHAAFEQWADRIKFNVKDRKEDGSYYWPFAQAAWEGWQARAKLLSNAGVRVTPETPDGEQHGT